MIADIVARLRARREPWTVSFETPVLDGLDLPDGSPAPVVADLEELSDLSTGSLVVDKYGTRRVRLDDGRWERDDEVQCESRLLWTLRPLYLIGSEPVEVSLGWRPGDTARPDGSSSDLPA